jgi:hypothetical protein
MALNQFGKSKFDSFYSKRQKILDEKRLKMGPYIYRWYLALLL